jgi:hypothetical protein
VECVIKLEEGSLIKNKGHIKLSKEVEMFEISEKAGEMIKESFKDKDEVPSIRVVYNEGG